MSSLTIARYDNVTNTIVFSIDHLFQVGFDIATGGLTGATQVHLSFLLVPSNHP